MADARYSAELRDLAPSWRRSLRAGNRSPKTIKSYLAALDQLADHLEDAGRSTAVDQIARSDVESFIGHLLDTRSAATAATRYRGLQQMFKWAVEEGERDVSPMEGMHPPRLDSKPVPVVADDDLRALLKATEGNGFDDRRDHAILRVFVDTGARLAEVSGLTVDDVDLDRGLLQVVGKGRKTRVVPVGARAVRALDRYVRVRGRHEHAGEARLWLGLRGPMTDSGIVQMVRRRCRQAGIEEFNVHRFRHGFAHSWLADGGSERDLMAIAGWESEQMLARYGSSMAAERAQDAHRRLSPGDKL